MPIDLLPDFMPILGQLDDLAVFALAVRLFIQLSPKPIVDELRFGWRRERPGYGRRQIGQSSEGSGRDYRVIG